MARVFYPYVAMPEKPLIARVLREQLDWDPVLWIAPREQHAEVTALFPHVHVQTIADAFYGRLIPNVGTRTPPPLDAALMGRLQGQIATMMAMMNYYGPPEVFPYSERERFARNLLLQWNQVIEALEPDIVFFEEAPHAPHTWAIYALCLEYAIPTPFLMPTAIPTLSMLKDRVDSPPLRLSEALQTAREHPSPTRIRPEVEHAAAALRTGESFSHWYMAGDAESTTVDEDPAEHLQATVGQMRGHLNRLRTPERWPHYAKSLLEKPLKQLEYRASRRTETSDWILLKHAGAPLGDPAFTLGDYSKYQKASKAFKDRLRRDYLARCSPPSPETDNYVYLALHYQPERTTDSDGGVYRDQYLAAATIHEALPDGWLLYVKEHPSQFAPALHGEKGRTHELYDDLERLERVRLIDPDHSSKELAIHAKAVATVTGTLGWEAVLNGTPALVFGYPWYEGCPGVFSVRGIGDARVALSAIGDGRTVSNEDVLAFMQAVSLAAFRVDLNSWVKPEPEISPEEQASETLAAMTWWTAHCLGESTDA